MLDLLENLRRKKKEIEDLQRQKARQEGQREQILKHLKEEFEIGSIEEIETELEKLGKELIKNEEVLKQHLGEMEDIVRGAYPKSATGKSEEE